MAFLYGEHKLTRYRSDGVAMSYNVRPERGHGPQDVSHPGFLEIELLDEGSHMLRLGSEVHEARSGDASIITQDCVHSWWTERSTARGYTVHLPVETVETIGRDLGVHPGGWRARVVRSTPEMRSLLSLMRSTVDGPDVLRGLMLEQLADTLVVATMRAAFVEVGASTPRPRTSIQRVDDLAGRLTEEYARDWTLDEMARHAGMSRFHFCREFKTRFGTSPRQFLVRRRLEIAKQELAHGNASVTAVALAAGFGSSSQFSKDFKRVFGVAPSDWSKIAHA